MGIQQVEEDLKKIELLKKQVKEMKWINETKITTLEEKTEKFVTWWKEIQEKKKPEVKLDLKGKDKDELLKMHAEFTEQKMKAVADQKFEDAHVLKEKEKLVEKALKKLGVTPPKTEDAGTKDAKEEAKKEEAKKEESKTEDSESK